MGTWKMGDQRATRAEEIATLQQGIDQGLSLIDSAEMYGEGASEQLIGEAIKGRRDQVFLVTKVYPHNASLKGTVAACERSLGRLGVDVIDLYLLHWRGRHPLEDTIAGFENLQHEGKIRHWGVSNFDTSDLAELYSLPGGSKVAVNQVLYNLACRGIEWDLQPWCHQRSIPIMAYSPIEQGRLLRDPDLVQAAASHGTTPAQLALAWVLRHDQVLAIPQTSNRRHLLENMAALELQIDPRMLAELDRCFPPPKGPEPLAML
jgi:diketogulonate reductase-like aldo/keto reductase